MIKILVNNLRIRKDHTTNSESLGFAKQGYHSFTDKFIGEYEWYHINEGWVANVDCIEEYQDVLPVKEDKSKNQIYIPNVLVNIREKPTTSSLKVGQFEKNSYYNVEEVVKMTDFNWYKIGDFYCAGIDEVKYIPIGQSDLKDKVEALKTALNFALEVGGKENELSNKVIELTKWIYDNFDEFDYDIVTEESEEIDILNTTDVHNAWVGYDEDGNYNTPIFSYKDIGNYRDKLVKNGIQTFIVDCGDWSRPCGDMSSEGQDAINEMTNNKFLLSTYGNHEFKWDFEQGIEILKKNKSMTACNIKKDGKYVFKPYRTVKVGNKRLAFIGVGYPSPNGNGDFNQDDTWACNGYTFLDGRALYKEVQSIIDKLKNFDYIFVCCHMDKITEESYDDDSRSVARSDLLIQNTHGLTAVFQGHFNYQLEPKIVLDNKGNKVLICYDAGSNLDCFGRLRIKNGELTTTLITERGQL